MRDILGSVRRSLVFRSSLAGDDGSVRGCLTGFVTKPPPGLPAPRKEEAPPIRWRKGELIGCGAFGRVYMGMNLDPGELLAIKLVLIAPNSASKEKTPGANIFVDNEGCIRVADFGASKKVVELATVNVTKSMKGTPYWMAPEVILQTGHSFSADIWSVGCTVIEMATEQKLIHQFQQTSHQRLKDFLLENAYTGKSEPSLRLSAYELLQHLFVTGGHKESHPAFCGSFTNKLFDEEVNLFRLERCLNSEA